MPKPTKPFGGEDDPQYLFSAEQLKNIGREGALVLGARCLLRNGVFAARNLYTKNRRAGLLLAYILHDFSACAFLAAMSAHAEIANRGMLQQSLYEFSSRITLGLSESRAVYTQSTNLALRASRSLLLACLAFFEGRKHLFIDLAKCVADSFNLLEGQRHGCYEAAKEDIRLLTRYFDAKPASLKGSETTVSRMLSTPLWPPPEIESEEWPYFADKFVWELEHENFPEFSGRRRLVLWGLWRYHDVGLQQHNLLNFARTELESRAVSNLLNRFFEVISRTPEKSISFESAMSAGAESPEPLSPPIDEPPKRLVSTGFSETAYPYTARSPQEPLQPGGNYLFWLKIGRLAPQSIERTPTELPTKGLSPGAKLRVVLFAFPDELEISKAGASGEMILQPDGTIAVSQQAFLFRNPENGFGEVENRLCFAVRCPRKEGKFRLRCSIYHKQILLQSRQITAVVSARQSPGENCLVSELDYAINHSLDLNQLEAMTPHKLSIMLNGGPKPGSSHQLRFVGEKEFASDSAIGEMTLETAINAARESMRLVCWGSRDEWDSKKAYKYDKGSPSFETDLIILARAGYRLYSDLVGPLAGGEQRKKELKALMRAPGLVQVACRQSGKELLPAALIYDHPLDTNEPSEICPDFKQSLGKGSSLTDCACFQGKCQSYGKLNVVCPSGFWGFRHELGLPVSLVGETENEDRDAAASLGCQDSPDLSVAVCLDPQFVLRAAHEKKLRALHPKLRWSYSKSRDETLTMLQASASHVIYFYCHGGMDGNFPYILVGGPKDFGITADNLEAYAVSWDPPGPLVFINGCKTTALQPSRAFDFVSAFINKAGATGVIGTEITVFEPLACAFAETFLQAFLVDEHPLGAAIRHSRLKLLQNKNPLGLVYIPFALASLRLQAQTP